MLSKTWKLALALSTLILSFQAHAGPRTVFVQLFEWPWKDIARECEVYLGPAGFSAVQVSPPHEHIRWHNSPWWERYQVVSHNLNSRSGNEAEFVDMIQRCRQAGVDVYADAVLNHMTGVPQGTGFAGTGFSHYAYPFFSYNDFHHCNRNGNDNIANYNDRYEVQNCELVDLADLATESEYVRNNLAQYLNHLLDLGVAGFRIDGAKHIPASDLAAIYAKLKRSAYIFHELIIFDSNSPVQFSEFLPHGDVTAYAYPYRLARGFKYKSIDNLLRIAQGFPPSEGSIVFVTNHDIERSDRNSTLGFNTPEQNLYRLAQIFMLAWPYGYPQVFSGYKFNNYDDGPPLTDGGMSHPVIDDDLSCQSSWTCEHRLPEVASMVRFRNQTDSSFYINNLWTNNIDQLAFGRGSEGFVVINFSDHRLQRDLLTSLPPGDYCNILGKSYNLYDGTCTSPVRVEKNGYIKANLSPMSAIALLKNSTLKKVNKL